LTNPTLLEHIFWIWTIKESYTKCLGLGLGFDFSRISVNFDALALHLAKQASDADPSPAVVLIDGQPAFGYEFTFFEVAVPGQASEEIYQGVIVRRLRPPRSDETMSNDASEGSMHQESLAGHGTVTQSGFIAKNRIQYDCQNPAYINDTLRSDPWLKLWDTKTLVQTADLFD
jgi:hypothetical protein